MPPPLTGKIRKLVFEGFPKVLQLGTCEKHKWRSTRYWSCLKCNIQISDVNLNVFGTEYPRLVLSIQVLSAYLANTWIILETWDSHHLSRYHWKSLLTIFVIKTKLNYGRLKVFLKTWSFTTLLIGCWQKVTWNDGTDICSKHKRPQEKPVNLDKRYEINVTAVTNTNCAAETNTSVHSSESGCFVWPDPPCFKWNP